MATLDDDLAKSVTEGFRQAQIDIVNQDLILSGTGDVTVTLADGSKKTGPSWTKLIAAANAAGTSAAAAEASAKNAKTSETNANSSKTAAATSATNAKTSETNAKTSETNAKTSETNAKTSENNASASASSAAASLAAAQLLTSVPYEAAPFPDVWAPLNDDLRLLAGSAPYDRLTISGQVLELPTKSATFTRASTATYIDKSGVLRTAAINEPRFEKEGLLVEGQSTNQVLNSEDPTKWAMTGGMTTSVITDGTAQAITLQVSPTVLAPEQSFASSATLALAVGDTLTLSCRFKGTDARFRFRFLLEGAVFGDVSFDCISGEIASQPTAGITATTTLAGGDGYTYATATLTVTTAGNYIGQFRSYYKAGALGNNIPLGTTFYLQTVQAEKNAVATSYIPTGAAAVTRAADNVTLQASGNCGFRITGDLFNRTVSLTLAINKMGLQSGSYHSAIATSGASNDIICRILTDGIRAYRGMGGPTISTTYPMPQKVLTQTLDDTNKMTLYLDGFSNSSTSAPVSPSGLPTNITLGANPAVVYHVRNFRIWHRVLTPNQINGLH